MVVETPCEHDLGETFDFDGQGRLHYRCAESLLRGNGELVGFPIKELVLTFDDGRSVVTRASNTRGDDYVVLDAQGVEISRLDPRDVLNGTVTPVVWGASRSANKGYVLFRHGLGTWGHEDPEYVAYRVDENSQWQLIRRVSVDQFSTDALVISDGRIFVNERDPATTFDNQIAVYHPDGRREIVWRDALPTGATGKVDRAALVREFA